MNTDLQECLDEITRVTLLDSYNTLITDYVTAELPHLLSYDERTEQKEMRKLCKAFRKVLEYYSTTEQFERIAKLPAKF